ncbi:hypothetical protein [Hymenobacter cellulosilyticus]|uniref:DUF4136 domain-containing protein n=1 Tax=Hymenobacter cellulosilyticus TaxID=2932248 RepID=A0A8T9Q7C0_9BACT|nr:hypothetical protein [Hymenobacter cellulosilyticus]UOQ73035.1 hypothetical protein MUN79_03400 [Hymenobacter cellulosilyticus]
MRKKFILAILLFGSGCKAFDPALLNPTAETLPTRLPTLTPEVQSERILLSFSPMAVPNDVRTLFEREVREVLSEPYGKSRGFLVLHTRRVSARPGLGFTFASVLTAGSLNLLGFPWARYRYVVDVQLDVLNQRRELIGSYRGTGQARATAGLYSRTNFSQPDRVLYLQCVRQGLDQIIPQLRPETARLQAALAL